MSDDQGTPATKPFLVSGRCGTCGLPVPGGGHREDCTGLLREDQGIVRLVLTDDEVIYLQGLVTMDIRRAEDAQPGSPGAGLSSEVMTVRSKLIAGYADADYGD
jgi:hypothetical protein